MPKVKIKKKRIRDLLIHKLRNPIKITKLETTIYPERTCADPC